MALKAGDAGDSLLKKISDVLPRDLWPSLTELLLIEHGCGVRDAVERIRQFREKYVNGRNALANRFYSVPRDVLLFEDQLLRTGHIPRGRPGRPRKDHEFDQISRFREEGKSWAQIALKLKKNPDACRQLFRRRLSEMEVENTRLRAEIERRQKESR